MSKARFAKVTISLPFDDLHIIDDFADAAGMTRSAVIQGLFAETLPPLAQAAVSLRQFNELDAAQRAGVLKEFEALLGGLGDPSRQAARVFVRRVVRGEAARKPPG